MWGGLLVYAPESAEIGLESILMQKEYRNTPETKKGIEGHLTAFQNVQKGIERPQKSIEGHRRTPESTEGRRRDSAAPV